MINKIKIIIRYLDEYCIKVLFIPHFSNFVNYTNVFKIQSAFFGGNVSNCRENKIPIKLLMCLEHNVLRSRIDDV